MILRNVNHTVTIALEDVTATPIINSNVAVTIGGIVKSQADSQRLKIKSTIHVSRADLEALMDILNDYTNKIYYTPVKPLWTDTVATERRVIMTGITFDGEANDGTNNINIISLDLEEVIDL